MTSKSKGLWVLLVTFILTALIALLRSFDAGYAKAIWLIWVGFSWNYFAYAFDKGMLPSVFVELDGGGKGKSTERTVFFWGTAIVHLAYLSLMAFAD